jgi:hypothetical protein
MEDREWWSIGVLEGTSKPRISNVEQGISNDEV